MAISKSRGAYGNGLSGIAPYAKRGGEIMQFTADGSNPNDVVGAMYRVHVFDSIGEHLIHFESDGIVDAFLVAGGGAGGAGYNNANPGGGGGAGGLVQQYGVGITAGTYRVKVGRGGAGKDADSWATDLNGENSIFGAMTAFGGGAGGSRDMAGTAQPGGSGGGSSDVNGAGGSGVSGQGNNGGSATGSNIAGGGGGAGAAGGSVSTSTSGLTGYGGDGLPVAFYSNEAIYYAGGGGGGTYYTAVGLPVGGLGGGAAGAFTAESNGLHASFYGGGGGGGASSAADWNRGGNGYQGIVMVRYRIS